MPRVRKIECNPASGKNYYVVDANFLANKYIPIDLAPTLVQADRISACQSWWEEIDRQVNNKRAIVYIPDICIAESFKVLAKKLYLERWFTPAKYRTACKKMRSDVSTNPRALRLQNRHIKYHDISTNRDIIIAVDRFYELFMKHKINVSLPDLIIVTTAKYIVDFFDIPKARLHIITLDTYLRNGTKEISELPNAYDPTKREDRFERIFQ